MNNVKDAFRERRIAHYRDKMCSAPTPEERKQWWLKMRQEILDRSPEQVERMERKLDLKCESP